MTLLPRTVRNDGSSDARRRHCFVASRVRMVPALLSLADKTECVDDYSTPKVAAGVPLSAPCLHDR
jgi:hypothetical protein